MVLPAEKHAKNADGFTTLIDLEPVYCPTERQVPETRQNVIMTLASVRRGQDTARSRANFENSRCRMLDGLIRTFAEAGIAFEQMIENQP